MSNLKNGSLCYLFTFIFSALALAQNVKPAFEGGEHIFVGDQVKIILSDSNPGRSKIPLHLPNGLALTYGEIISLGDLYASLSKPISSGSSEVERRALFMESFNSFAEDPRAAIEAPKLLNVLHQEQKIVKEAIDQGKDPEPIYKQLSFETNRQLNCLTGGGCTSTWYLWPGRYLKLALMDFDHFGNEAWISYQVGHQLAIEEATKAHESNDFKRLELAYAMNAYANHFLTDRFASGHIRTPRVPLANQVTPSSVGSILSGYMHGEENSLGLHVHNIRGDQWIAYGDRTYFCAKSADNRRILAEAMQTSADVIYEAFKKGLEPKNDDVFALIPFPDEIDNHPVYDVATLFYVDSIKGTILRRVDLENVNDNHWTDQWWGWSTLLALSKTRGLPLMNQATLATSPEGYFAYKLGLITDPDIVNYIHEKYY